MKKKELFEKTVSVLTKAYINNTLQHGSCCGCAVGNLVCAANNIVYEKDKVLYWTEAFSTTVNYRTGKPEMKQRISAERYKNLAKVEIDSTGYSLFQLAAIEKAFETEAYHPAHEEDFAIDGSNNYPADKLEEAMFKGLCAVYDTLCVIHEVEEEDHVMKAEEVFVK